MSSYGVSSYTDSSSSGQVVTGLILVGLIFIVLFVSEVIYNSVRSAQKRFHTLVDYTASSDTRTITIYQDPTKYSDAVPIGLSVNERTGVEFAYSFFINVGSSTFTGMDEYKHVFHKGYQFPWPLMGPGVFMSAKDNRMRVVMNTYKNPYTFADIKNFPVGKWVHVVLNCQSDGLDIYINGTLANRISFTGSLPYQNFQNIVIFANVNSSILGQGSTPACMGEYAAPDNVFKLAGSFTGQISNLKYARYALSVTEIQSLMAAGPSYKKPLNTVDTPPYLADDWTATQG